MGSTNFEQYVAGTDPAVCYRNAVDDALHEHGHDSYNGSISTTSGFRLHQRQAVTMQQAYEIAEGALDQYNKWEECGAIPIQKTTELDTREVECEVFVPGPGQPYERKAEIDALVKATVKLRAGEEVIGWEIEQPRYSWDGTQSVATGRKTVITRKVTVEATEGKTETRYCVEGPGIRPRPWAEMHPTQAAARKALKDWLDSGQGQSRGVLSPQQSPMLYQDYEVIGITRRVSGEPVVRGYAEVVKTCYPVKAKVGKVTRTGEIEGYLFFGWAAI